jgi:hypothetical protein
LPRPRNPTGSTLPVQPRPAPKNTPTGESHDPHRTGLLAAHNSSATTAGFWDESDTVAATLQSAAAGSVAARGILFANAHPAAASWQPLRGPTCSLPERAAAENLEQLSVARRRSHLALGGAGRCGALAGGGGQVAARALPFLRALAGGAGYGWLAPALPVRWTYIWKGALTRTEAAGAAAAEAAAEAAALAVSLATAGLVGGGGGEGGGRAGEGAERDEIEDD